jgi:hypothetical protein
MMAQPCLFIFFSGTLGTIAFLVLQLPHIADWLWQNTQADTEKQKFFDLLKS